MAGWEEELTSLLRELGVEQEGSPSHPAGDTMPNSTHKTSRSRRRYFPRLPKRDERGEPSSGTLPDAQTRRKETSTPYLPGSGSHTPQPESREQSEQDDDPWITDASAMRREIDSIVKQVVRQMQGGNLAPALKDDIMIVLRALRRRALATQQATSDEAYLESATAMLHFCRLVLQLNEQDIHDF